MFSDKLTNEAEIKLYQNILYTQGHYCRTLEKSMWAGPTHIKK